MACDRVERDEKAFAALGAAHMRKTAQEFKEFFMKEAKDE